VVSADIDIQSEIKSIKGDCYGVGGRWIAELLGWNEVTGYD